MKLEIAAMLAMISLSGCNSPLTEQKQTTFCDKELSYCIGLPEAFSSSTWKPTIGPDGKSTAHTASTNVPVGSSGDVAIYVYHHSPSLHCKEIGVSDPETMEHAGTQIVRGKVDFPSDYELTQLQPDCRVYKPYNTSYILCSEKDDVQVAICISQVTDDPALANSILDTFRWTPESPS